MKKISLFLHVVFACAVATGLILSIWIGFIIRSIGQYWCKLDSELTLAADDYDRRLRNMYRRHGLNK